MKKMIIVTAAVCISSSAYGGVIHGLNVAIDAVNDAKSAIQTKIDQAKSGITEVKNQLGPAKEQLKVQSAGPLKRRSLSWRR